MSLEKCIICMMLFTGMSLFAQTAPVPKKPTPSTSSTEDARLVHELNASIRKSALTSPNYEPIGFSLDLDRKSLIWTRISTADCDKGVARASAFAETSTLDPNILSTTNRDGTIELQIMCRNGKDCIEDLHSSCAGMHAVPDVPYEEIAHGLANRYYSGNFNKLIGVYIPLKAAPEGGMLLASKLAELIRKYGGTESERPLQPEPAREKSSAFDGNESSTPSVGETVAYINEKLRANPTRWWQTSGCSGHEQTISVDPGGRVIKVREIYKDSEDKRFPCGAVIFELPLFSLGDGKYGDYGSYMGRIDTADDGRNVMLSCANDVDCITKSYETTGHTAKDYRIQLHLLGDDDSVQRVSKAVVHLTKLLKQQGTPTESDPFGPR